MIGFILGVLIASIVIGLYWNRKVEKASDAGYERGRQVGMQLAEHDRRPMFSRRRVEGPHDIHPDGATCERCRRFRGCFSDGYTFYGKHSCTFSPSRYDPATPQSALDQMAPAQKGD